MNKVKMLGKISKAEFGKVLDREYLMGLQLFFRLGDSSGIGDGGRYVENISPECRFTEIPASSA